MGNSSEDGSSVEQQRHGSDGMRKGEEEDREVLCPVCLQLLRDPFLAWCGHSFCYTCISAHLADHSTCPCCSQQLSQSSIYPNILLDKVLRKLQEAKALDRAPPAEHLQLLLQNGFDLSVKDIDGVMERLSELKIKFEKQESEENMEMLIHFLRYWHQEKQASLSQAQDELRAIEGDISFLKREHTRLSDLRKFFHSNSVSEAQLQQPTTHLSTVRRKRQIVDSEYDALQASYLRACRGSQGAEDAGPSSGLRSFQNVLSGYTRYRHLRVLGEMRQETGPYSPSIISSIEFDRSDEHFATAGVSGSLKVFQFSKIGEGKWRPATEVAIRSKLSCVSWDNYADNLIASSDYEGAIKIWDVSNSKCVADFEEHERRAWSVDFSQLDPSMLLSGSDDGKVKVWCNGVRGSICTIEINANICSVKYNPSANHLIAAGSADHCIYYYDLRHTMSPLHVFSGHQKAVSYVKFMSSNEMLSASTDGTLRLWNVREKRTIETMRGHLNEKNFVGLSTSREYIACGSESNEVFVYHADVSRPVICYKYPIGTGDDAPFISSVCWKRNGSTLLAANSQGIVRALMLVSSVRPSR